MPEKFENQAVTLKKRQISKLKNQRVFLFLGKLEQRNHMISVFFKNKFRPY